MFGLHHSGVGGDFVLYYFYCLHDVFVFIALDEFCFFVFYILSVELEFVSHLAVAKLGKKNQINK